MHEEQLTQTPRGRLPKAGTPAWSCFHCAGSAAAWGRVLARLGQQGLSEAWKWEEASARPKSRGKRIQKTQRNNIEFFLIFNFQLTMENVKVCEIEWWGQCAEGGPACGRPGQERP